MDFNLSKENIQPLRGGRNVSQLEVALQAQDNSDLQRELTQKKEEFENLIKNDKGPDPLEHWFSYICWVEQSFPKGHEGSLLNLLEHCLKSFENEKQYVNDRRFCKLWIKYIDYQQNPLELYHMVHARGLCRGCADLYKAWAYYHEATGDYQSANQVLECGKRELAQPYEELEIAHSNLFMAAGQHMINGPDERRLLEKRHALTSLNSYRLGRVSNNRQTHSVTPAVLPSTASTSLRSNVPIPIYEDRGEQIPGTEAAPVSIITIAKRQEIRKENTLKPGPWVTVPVKKHLATKRLTPSFTVAEDGAEPTAHKFPEYTEENYKDFIVSLTVPEPKDPRFIPMYPKSKVYPRDFPIEISLEELRASRYLAKNDIEIEEDEALFHHQSLLPSYMHTKLPQQIETRSPSRIHLSRSLFSTKNETPAGNKFTIYEQSPVERQASPASCSKFDCDIWQSSPADRSDTLMVPKNNLSKFVIYEQSNLGLQEQIEPKGSAMKTPAMDLNAEELAETGSRSGMDVAAAAPVSAKRLPLYDEEDYKTEDDDPVDTQLFNFNLNEMKVSTPDSKPQTATKLDVTKSTRKQLFNYEKALSTILEDSKSHGSSSSSSNATTRSNVLVQTKPNMETISEEHNGYLAQNLMVNEDLRRSALGILMDYEEVSTPQQQPSSPIKSVPSPIFSIPRPVNVTPIKYVPSDPFKPSLISELLDKVAFPGPHTKGYFELTSLPKLMVRTDPVTVGHDRYIIERQLGKGTYGTVFRGHEVRTGRTVALKHQKPANKWEFYICRELRARLADHPLRERFMDVKIGYFSDVASILISDFMPCGSLLDLANAVKQKSGRSMKEPLCIYFCLDMLRVVQAMHDVKIIHADIKPDNFLVQVSPDGTIILQLIDFGCSIDMTLFPHDACFTRRVNTEDFVCCEMRDERPWNYHTDLFCVAATAHVLLFEKYLQLRKKDGHWSIQQRIPRYLRIDLWNMFFSTLLNQQSGPADSAKLQKLLEDSLKSKNDDYHTEMRSLLNILKNR